MEEFEGRRKGMLSSHERMGGRERGEFEREEEGIGL